MATDRQDACLQSTEKPFPVTAIVKLAHARLLEVVEKRGGTTACAKELGISHSTLAGWIYLRFMPSCGPVYKVKGKRQFRKLRHNTAKAVSILCQWAEASPEELFPGYVREALPSLDRTRRITREITPKQLGHVPPDLLTYEPDLSTGMQQEERKQRIDEVLKTLNYREREIIKLRYGLGADGLCYTLEEVGHIFKVSRDRISQIERRAIRRIQGSDRLYMLCGL